MEEEIEEKLQEIFNFRIHVRKLATKNKYYIHNKVGSTFSFDLIIEWDTFLTFEANIKNISDKIAKEIVNNYKN